ncbi:MAG: CHASE2 domain-containing protein, partial [Gammaproteobacteria bacterium]
MKNFVAKRLKPLLFITIFVASITSAMQYFNVLQRLEYIAYDWQLTLARQHKTPPQDVKIVLVDDASLQAMDPVAGDWPWPRSVFADVIDFLAKGKPKAIIFDILFSESETEEQANFSDTRLIEATRNAGNVHHAMLFMTDDGIAPEAAFPLPTGISRFGATSINAASVQQPPLKISHQNETRLVYNNFLAPVSGLYQAAAGLGVITKEKDADGVLRRMTPFFQYQDQYFRALSTASLSMADSKSE